MDAWNAAIHSWVVVLIQLGAAIAVVGLAWNAVQWMLDTALTGNAQSLTAFLYRALGIFAALTLLLLAPRLVGELSGLLRTALAR
jgi:hypothetical protein